MTLVILFCIAVIHTTTYSQASLVSALSHTDAPVSYEHAQVWRTELRTSKDAKIFNKFKANGDISLWNLNGRRADYLVHDQNMVKVQQKLKKKKLNHTVLIMDVQKMINGSKVHSLPWTDSALRNGHRLNFHSYPSFDIIEEYFTFVEENFRSILRLSTIGTSVQNRTIKVMRVSNGNPGNKAIVLLGGQHSREWVSITSALYIANNIITKFDEQPKYMQNKDWYIVPLLNPDGYVHTQKFDRLWRKNRRRSSKSGCYGVDLNRNFPTHWQIKGLTQTDICAEDYAGPFAFSEPESLSLLNLLDIISPKVPKAFVDFHAYGQMIVYPWGVKNKVSPHKSYLESTVKIMKSGMLNATGRKYTHGTPPSLLYSVSGTAIDWFHSKGIQLSYAIETRDNGAHGFLLPASEIEDTGKELLAGIRALAKSVESGIRLRDGSSERTWF